MCSDGEILIVMSLYRISLGFLTGGKPRLQGCESIYDKSQAEYWLQKLAVKYWLYLQHKWDKSCHVGP